MQLDYIHKINVYGDNIVRLYDFGKAEAILFQQAIQQTIITNKESLDLSTLTFIQARNCNLTLRISPESEGIITEDYQNFFCDLPIEGYHQILELLIPFCKKETKGYQFLYDIDSLTDFLFSPAGSW